jgi:O-acetyl-ADP-ribose deacetylase (regulator of RNase III)
VYGENSGADSSLLTACHRASLELAMALGARTVAFPAISCGVFGYPAQEAAPLAVAAVRSVVAEHPDAFEVVRFVVVSQRIRDLFDDAIRS